MKRRAKKKSYRQVSGRRNRVIISAVIVSSIYLLVRLTTLGNGWLLLLSIPLFMAEIHGFAQLLLLVFQAWRIPERPTGTLPSSSAVDIMVDASRADAAMLERTLVGATTVEAQGSIRVVDSSARPELAAKAEGFGASYEVDIRLEHVAAQALYELAETDVYVWLEAGQVPMPDLITRMSARFADPQVAVCQAAVGLFNADSLVHIQRGRDEDALQRDVLWPGLDRCGAAPFFGPASMIRREAIDSVDGFPIQGIAVVERALVMLHSNGWTSAYEPKQLVRTVAPDTLDGYLEQRKRRSIETLGAFFTPENPLRIRSLSRRQRWSHVAMQSGFGSGVRQLVVTAVLVATLLTGRLPFEGPLGPMLALFAGSTCLGALARLELARGSMKIGDWTRHGWRTLGADFAGLFAITGRTLRADSRTIVGRSGLPSLGRLRLLTATVIVLDVALLIRAATIFGEGLLPAFSAEEQIIVIAFGLITLVPMVDVLQLVITRRQRRKSFRLQVGLDVELGDIAARTVDLATSGVGVLIGYSPAVGTSTAIRLMLPMVDGTPRWISGTAIVRAANPDPSGLVRVGLEFANLTDDARIALVEYCIVGHAANEAQPQRRPSISESPSFLIRSEGQDHRSLRVLTGAASAAAVITLAMGPAVSASEPVAAPVEQVCVVRVDGTPVAGTTIDMRTDLGWEDVGETGESGCVNVESSAVPTEFAATRDAVQLETSLPVDEAGNVTFVMQRHAIRLLTTEGTGVDGASVRYFTDTWHDVGETDPFGIAQFDTLTAAVDFEVTWRGGRMVLPLPRGGLDVVLGRVDAGGVSVDAIDRGQGWEPFHDNIQVMPGRIAVRLADGSTIKVEVDAGHALDLRTGSQTSVTPSPVALEEDE